MPEAAFCIMLAMLEYDGGASVHQMSAASGYDVSKYSKIVSCMVMVGWMQKIWNGRWSLTERGRIVSAIEVGRRARATRAGVRIRKMSVRHFCAVAQGEVSLYELPGTDVVGVG